MVFFIKNASLGWCAVWVIGLRWLQFYDNDYEATQWIKLTILIQNTKGLGMTIHCDIKLLMPYQKYEANMNHKRIKFRLLDALHMYVYVIFIIYNTLAYGILFLVLHQPVVFFCMALCLTDKEQ